MLRRNWCSRRNRNEEIKIAIGIGIGKAGTSISANIGYPEGSVSTFLGVSGSARRTGVAKEIGVAVVIADEKIKIAVIVDIANAGWTQ